MANDAGSMIDPNIFVLKLIWLMPKPAFMGERNGSSKAAHR
jgi:hypothetical protein